jgi:hypothetical protein
MVQRLLPIGTLLAGEADEKFNRLSAPPLSIVYAYVDAAQLSATVPSNNECKNSPLGGRYNPKAPKLSPDGMSLSAVWQSVGGNCIVPSLFIR